MPLPTLSPEGAANLLQVLFWRSVHQANEPALTFLPDGSRVAEPLTYGELDRRARILAAGLQAICDRERPVMLVYPSSTEYVEAFLGCLYAGVVAAPAYPPRFDHYDARLRAIAEDARPQLVLTHTSLLEGEAPIWEGIPGLTPGRCVPIDRLAEASEEAWRRPALEPSTLAFLQYTSGSTAGARGVMISHGNLLHNQRLLQRSTGNTSRSTHVSWLPLHHDLGLVATLLQSLYVGAHLVLLPTEEFIRHPGSWLRAISDYRGATSLAPNFAFELCVNKVPEEEIGELDLSSWTLALNGAEPVRPGTLERFSRTFSRAGFRPETFYPAFGLAEATGFVSGGERAVAPSFRWLDRAALEDGRVVEVETGMPISRPVVGLGTSGLDQKLRIVDPTSREPCPAGRVGEIWVTGPSVSRGYWNRPDESAETFGIPLAGEDGAYLRTGDLGFLHEGELYFTSRLKDLIIVDGLNHSPQDIEQTVEGSHDSLRPGFCAAFAVDLEDGEGLVVAAELRREVAPRELRALSSVVRREVSLEHGLEVHRLLLLRPGTIPRTSSGKIRRRACSECYRDDRLEVVWTDPETRP